MKKILFLITTYNRDEQLFKLLDDISHQPKTYDIATIVLDDGSYDETNPVAKANAENIKGAYLLQSPNKGKKKYWETINTLWAAARVAKFDYVIQLPDDVRLKIDFLNRAVNLYEGIKDSKKICMNLSMDEGRRGKPNWTGVWPIKKGDVILTQWNDLCFIAPRRFFDILDWQVIPISPNAWNTNPMLGSQVGKQISVRLMKSSRNMYQVDQTLVFHNAGPSVMNPEERLKNPMITK